MQKQLLVAKKMTIAEKINHLRIECGLSQEELAKFLAVSRQSISKWEKGETLPQLEKIVELARFFRVSTDELLDNQSPLKKNESTKTKGKRSYFGTDGFRGESGAELTAHHAFLIGRFLGWYFSGPSFASRHPNGARAKICIGKDARRSSYMLEYAISSGIASSGADAYILHVTTTPSVSYVTRNEGFDCGVMITASHNAFYDNGIKILNSQGEKMEEDVTRLIEAYLDHDMEGLGLPGEDDLPYAKKEKVGQVVDHVFGRNRYIGYLISCSATSFRDLKIGLDCANGSAWYIARSVFAALGATLYVIGDHPDGLNENKGCGSTHIEELQKLVKENNLDVGFAFDGDADRCLAIDQDGSLIDGDKILYILAQRAKRHNRLPHDTVVSTIMSNSGLEKALSEIGMKNIQTKVGDRFVYEEMMKNDYWLGGEQSGHIIIRKYATTGDGILTAIKLTEEMIEEKASLGKLSEAVHLYPQILKNVKVFDKSVVLEDEAIQNEARLINKELKGNGRLLLRESGTEPVIRIMVESDDLGECNRHIDRIYRIIQRKGYLDEAD